MSFFSFWNESKLVNSIFFFNLDEVFFGVPHLATCIFLFFDNEPELGVGIDPGMAFTPLPSSMEQGSNPQPSDCEPSAHSLDHNFRLQFRWSYSLFLACFSLFLVVVSHCFSLFLVVSRCFATKESEWTTIRRRWRNHKITKSHNFGYFCDVIKLMPNF